MLGRPTRGRQAAWPPALVQAAHQKARGPNGSSQLHQPDCKIIREAIKSPISHPPLMEQVERGSPIPRYIHVLTPATCEHELLRKRGLCRYH